MARKTSPAQISTGPQKDMLLVLGMHRSGTSALSGMLNKLGCALPKTVMPASPDNVAGYFESKAVADFNDALLGSIGSHWSDWTKISPDWLASAQGRAAQKRAEELILSEFGEEPLVILKDPRICRMAALWMTAAQDAGYRVLPVVAARNPLEVAKSLQKRNDFSFSAAMLLWLRHMLEAEAATRHHPRFFTSYVTLLENWPGMISRMEPALDIKFPNFNASTTHKIEIFLASELRHHSEAPGKVFDNPTLSDWIRSTFRIFSKWAEQGEDKTDYAKLDQILLRLNEADQLYEQILPHFPGQKNPLLKELQDTQKKQAGLEATLAAEEKRSAQTEALRDERAKLEATLTAIRQERDELGLQVSELTDAQRATAALHEQRLLDESKHLQDQLTKVEAALQLVAQERDALIAERDVLQRKNDALTSAEAQYHQQMGQLTALLISAETTTQAALAAQGEANQAMTRVLSERNRDVETLHTQSAALSAVEQTLAETRGELSQVQSALAQRSLEAEQYLQQIQEVEKEWDGTTRQELAAQIEHLRRSEERSNRELGRLASLMATAETASEALAAKAESLSGQLDASRDAVVRLEQHLQETVQRGIAERHSVQAELAAAERLAGEQDQKISLLIQQLHELRGSTFWRMTAPARFLVDRLRSLKQ